MIERHTFRETLYTLRNYIDGLDRFEKSLETYFSDNFLTKIIDRTITTLAQGFFPTSEVDEYFVGDKLCDDCDEIFKTNFETIEDLLYHYTCSSNFGREYGMMDDTYVIKNKDGEVIQSFNGDSPDDLYTIITKFMARNDDNIHIIDCSSLNRGKKKDEVTIS